MNDEKDATQRILDIKTRQPEYQRLDMDPKVGGKSLLHDEFGIPKVGPANRTSIPIMKEISSELIKIKASKPGKIKIRGSSRILEDGNYIQIPSFTGSNISPPDDDDKFIPPKSNFVSVGHADHVWYDDKVAGPSKVKSKAIIIDNNDYIGDAPDATDKLQGINPLSQNDSKTDEAIKFFAKRLDHVKSLVISQLAEITEIKELTNLRENTFGKKGLFMDVVDKLTSLNIDKFAVGALLNQTYTELDLEIQGKEFELQAEDEAAAEVTKWPEDIAQVVLPSTKDSEDEDKPDDEDSITDRDPPSNNPDFPEGHYAVCVDDNLVSITDNIGDARNIISNLVLNDNLELGQIQLLKRIKIDFGIILEE